MLDPKNAKLRPLRATDLLWVFEMGFWATPEVALILRGLPTKSVEPVADLETILELPPSDLMPYLELLEEQALDRGDGEFKDTGFYVYALAHPVGEIDAINLRPPKIRDLTGILGNAGPDADMTLISRLSGVQISELKKLHYGDFRTLQEVIQRFLRGTGG